jgi:succinate dehydrogenase / fumarate reductase flavoprotein subunit
MQDLVGLIRDRERAAGSDQADRDVQAARAADARGRRRTYNPGWHIALDLASLLTVAECCALAALERKESRGGHTRDDHPYTDDTWGKINVVIRERQGALALQAARPLPEMPAELKALFQERK